MRGNAAKQRIGAALIALGATACCPIPFPMDETLVRALDVHVTHKNQPVEGAEVVVARYEYYPHFQPESVRRVIKETDAKGGAQFTHRSEYEWHMPLMMHGVPGYGWQLCVQAEGYQSVAQGVAAGSRDPNGPETADKIEVQLEAGKSTPCGELLGVSKELPTSGAAMPTSLLDAGGNKQP